MSYSAIGRGIGLLKFGSSVVSRALPFILGHRQIGVVTGPLVSPLSRDRLQGVKSCARKQKAERTCAMMQADFSIESGAVGAERLLGCDEPPTAIFSFSDEMAMGVIQTAKRRGLRIHDDISVVGFDDIRFARCIDPPLTTIAQPMRAIGEGTVRLLLEILGGCSSPPASMTLPHTLIIRSSTAAPHPASQLLFHDAPSAKPICKQLRPF